WSFGDGTYSVEPNVTHAYAEPGEYVASVQVRDLAGAVSSSKVWLQVNPLLNGTASASTHSTSVDSDVGFVGTVAGGTAPYTFWWQFGDEDWGTGPAASHQYLYAGVFPASVTINDSAGASQFIPMTVTVVPGTNQSAPSTNPPPGGPGSSPPGNTPAPPGRNGTVGLPTDIQHVGSNVASLPLGDAVLYAGIAAVLGFAAASAWSRRRQPPVRRAPRAGLRSMGTRARQPRPHSRPDTPGGSRGSTDPN
ncbi:MAG: PKD domain-containing protein, partial [Thermoplasmata archaeon]|nr:PKD domain-containing protein [Thermoplasmata archaeon]